MVEKISVQIALEGTEEVKRQLAGVSEAGQQCFADISAAAAKAGGFDKLDPTLMTRKFQQFGIKEQWGSEEPFVFDPKAPPC